MRSLLRSASLALLVCVSACVDAAPNRQQDEVLLSVNSTPVLLSRFQDEMDRIREELGDSPVLKKNAFEQLRQRIVQQLIEETLLAQQARKHNIEVSNAEIDAEIVLLHGSNKSLHRKILRQHYKTETKWREAIRHSLLRLKVADQLFPAPTTVSEKAIEDLWKETKKTLVKSPEILLSQIVVAKKEKADKLFRIVHRSPKKFEDLAREYSLTPEGEQGGTMGWVRKADLPKAFLKAFRLAEGKIGRPVKSPYGYHIFWVRKKRAGQTPVLTNYRKRIRKQIRQNLQITEYRKGMMALVANADVQIRKGVLARVHW